MALPYSLPHTARHHPRHPPPRLPQGCHLQGTAQSHRLGLAPSSPPVESLLGLHWPDASKVISHVEMKRLSHMEITTTIISILPLIYIFL